MNLIVELMYPLAPGRTFTPGALGKQALSSRRTRCNLVATDARKRKEIAISLYALHLPTLLYCLYSPPQRRPVLFY